MDEAPDLPEAPVVYCSVCRDLSFADFKLASWKDAQSWYRDGFHHIRFAALAKAAGTCAWCRILQAGTRIFWGPNPAAQSAVERHGEDRNDVMYEKVLILEPRPGCSLLAHRTHPGNIHRSSPYYGSNGSWGKVRGPDILEFFTAAGPSPRITPAMLLFLLTSQQVISLYIPCWADPDGCPEV
jgi:hypothetical protein